MSGAPSVLIVDDDDITVTLMRRVLDRAGVTRETRVASNGLEALQELRDHPTPDLILLDINMPRMDGFEFLEAYREFPDDVRDRSTIVMVTTSSLERDRSRALADPHVAGFLEKPLTVDHAAWLMEVVTDEAG